MVKQASTAEDKSGIHSDSKGFFIYIQGDFDNFPAEKQWPYLADKAMILI